MSCNGAERRGTCDYGDTYWIGLSFPSSSALLFENILCIVRMGGVSHLNYAHTCTSAPSAAAAAIAIKQKKTWGLVGWLAATYQFENNNLIRVYNQLLAV